MNIQTGFSQWLEKWRRSGMEERKNFLIKAAIVLFCVAFGVALMTEKKKPVAHVNKPKVEEKKKGGIKEEDLLLGAAVDQKSYVQRMETQYFSVVEKNQNLEQKVDTLEQQLTQLAQKTDQIVTNISSFDEKLNTALTQAVQTATGPMGGPGAAAVQNYTLDVKDLKPIKKADHRTIYLPAGSFVRGTLLTGVYAPSDQNNPLPVLIRLNEAFTGPNEARIPLKGAFAIGKATGDLTSERALIQVSVLSSVFPSGQAFEDKGNLGYITDTAGQLGLKGIVVRNTGFQLAMSFMTGFMGGAAQAFSDAETQTTTGDNGTTRKSVVGSSAKNAAWSGAAASATKLSDYYNQQLENIVPAIRVESGVEVIFIVMQGVKLYGLSTDSTSSNAYLD